MTPCVKAIFVPCVKCQCSPYAGPDHASEHAQRGALQHSYARGDGVLRGYRSMPANYHQAEQQDDLMGPYPVAVQSSKETPQGITPKSIFEWQPPSGSVTPTTPTNPLMRVHLGSGALLLSPVSPLHDHLGACAVLCSHDESLHMNLSHAVSVRLTCVVAIFNPFSLR